MRLSPANYNVTHSYLTFGVRASERMRVLSLQKLWSVLGFIAGPGDLCTCLCYSFLLHFVILFVVLFECVSGVAFGVVWGME